MGLTEIELDSNYITWLFAIPLGGARLEKQILPGRTWFLLGRGAQCFTCRSQHRCNCFRTLRD